MCGICGFYGFSKPLLEKDILNKMTNSLSHRGPDDSGTLISGNVGMGHRRLSIIDLSNAGHQPMISADNSAIIAYNGELYNYQYLKNMLIQNGIPFKSNSDTEVVLQSYLKWGENIFKQLEGMFAFALWDKKTKTFYLVRDRFGIKPIYYLQTKIGLIFGSEIKAILASGIVDKKIDEKSLNEFIWYGNSLGNNTLLKGIKKLLPGSYIKIQSNKIDFHEYWNIKNIKNINDNLVDAKKNVLNKLDLAVKNHLISDVPVGIFLSGGIDSSAITALASKHYHGKISTFSVDFDFNQGFSELSNAKIISDKFNTNHHEMHIKGSDLPSVIENLIESHDEPFSDAANIPLFLLTRELKGSIKVVLQGDGGDEIFAGYRRYNILSKELFWQWFSKFGHQFSKVYPRTPRFNRYKRFMYALKQSDSSMRMALLLTQDSPINNPAKILNSEIQDSISAYNPFQEYLKWDSRFKDFDAVRKMLYTDCKVQLPNTFLEKVDKSTMANSIEVRVPFLDNNLTDYVMGLPSSYKVRMGIKKWILKESLKGEIPDKILNGKKKGFSVPFDYWLKNPLSDYMCQILLDGQSRSSKLFDNNILKKKISNHLSGYENNGFILWKALNLAIWYDKYLK